jgi:hypothetical protein
LFHAAKLQFHPGSKLRNGCSSEKMIRKMMGEENTSTRKQPANSLKPAVFRGVGFLRFELQDITGQ